MLTGHPKKINKNKGADFRTIKRYHKTPSTQEVLKTLRKTGFISGNINQLIW
jgi:hypothetical protein